MFKLMVQRFLDGVKGKTAEESTEALGLMLLELAQRLDEERDRNIHLSQEIQGLQGLRSQLDQLRAQFDQLKYQPRGH